MTTTATWAEFAEILTANTYMVLGTADAGGSPWVTPVFFQPDDEHALLWVSSPAARHSRNIATRPTVAATVFDSRVAVGHATAAYVAGAAAMLPDAAAAAALQHLNRGLPDGRHLTVDDVVGDGPMRFYRLTVAERFVLVRGGDPRTPHQTDSRLPVPAPTGGPPPWH